MLPKSKIALVQVAKRKLGLDDDTYRDLLLNYGGKDSATRLDERGFKDVMDRFAQLGFVSTRASAGPGVRANMATAGQIDLIRVLWRQTLDDRSDPASIERGLRTWLSKYHHVSDVRFLTYMAAHKAIGGLQTMINRRAKRDAQS